MASQQRDGHRTKNSGESELQLEQAGWQHQHRRWRATQRKRRRNPRRKWRSNEKAGAGAGGRRQSAAAQSKNEAAAASWQRGGVCGESGIVSRRESLNQRSGEVSAETARQPKGLLSVVAVARASAWRRTNSRQSCGKLRRSWREKNQQRNYQAAGIAYGGISGNDSVGWQHGQLISAWYQRRGKAVGRSAPVAAIAYR